MNLLLRGLLDREKSTANLESKQSAAFHSKDRGLDYPMPTHTLVSERI